MDMTIEDSAPPGTLSDRIEALQPGDALTISGGKLGAIRQTVTRLRKKHPARVLRTHQLSDGRISIWRSKAELA